MPGPRPPCAFVLALLAAAALSDAAEPPRALTIRTEPVALDATDPGIDACGRLEYRGGLALEADDPQFGGFSGMALADEGQRLVAVSDQGRWLTARLIHDEGGRLAGVSEGRLGILLGPEGAPLAEKSEQDAESVALLPDGSLLVGFEHQHRLWRYPGVPPQAVLPRPYPPPKELHKAPPNGGIESLAVLPDGRLVALTEYWVRKPGLRGWVGRDGKWKELWYPLQGAYRPSDACALPDGDLLVLERAYSPQRGIVGVRLVRLAAVAVKPGVRLQGIPVAELRPPFVLDNFEGIACRRSGDETLVYLLSDDNFNPEQRTLLLLFALR